MTYSRTQSASLIIPCYNEALNLPQLLERCQRASEASGVQIILVDNGSSDDSPQILHRLLPHYPGCRSVRVEQNRGYGYGILAGLQAASSEILGWTHADLQTDPMDAVRALKLMEGRRTSCFVKGRRRGRALGDLFFTVGMSLFESILMGKRLWDINAQPTFFSREFFKTWKDPPHDFALDLYAYYLARRQGRSVLRYGVQFGVRAFGSSHWNINWRAKLKFIWRTMQFSWQLRKRTWR